MKRMERKEDEEEEGKEEEKENKNGTRGTRKGTVGFNKGMVKELLESSPRIGATRRALGLLG